MVGGEQDQDIVQADYFVQVIEQNTQLPVEPQREVLHFL